MPRAARGERLWAHRRGEAAGAGPPDRQLSGRTDSGRGGDGRAGGWRCRPGAGPAPPAVGAADTRGRAAGVQMRRRRRGARVAEEEPSPGRGRRREPRRQESRNRFPSFSRLPAWDPRPRRTGLLGSHAWSCSWFVFSLCTSFSLLNCPRGEDAPR